MAMLEELFKAGPTVEDDQLRAFGCLDVVIPPPMLEPTRNLESEIAAVRSLGAKHD